MTQATFALRFDEVSFRFEREVVLSRLSLKLEQGVTAALIGRNGAGKTTLLRLACGVLQPLSGSIELFGEDLAKMKLRQAARTIALIPQLLEIPFRYTVEQVVAQGRTPHQGLFQGPNLGDREATECAMERAKVAHLRRRVFNDLSGGERQRVKIALGLAQEPKVLLLDEPTQNQDPGRQVELLDLLGQLRTEGVTILAAMHELHLIETQFSQVFVLQTGGFLESGAPAEMLQTTVLRSAFDGPVDRHPMLRMRPE